MKKDPNALAKMLEVIKRVRLLKYGILLLLCILVFCGVPAFLNQVLPHNVIGNLEQWLGRMSDEAWLSFWASWIGAVCSIAMSIIIFIAQTKQGERFNQLQTALTVATSTPSLKLNKIRLYSCLDDEGLKSFPQYNDIAPLGAGEIAITLETEDGDDVPPYCQLRAESLKWKFRNNEQATFKIDESMQKIKNSKNTKMILRLKCADEDFQMWFNNFYFYPLGKRRNGRDMSTVEITLKMINHMWKGVTHNEADFKMVYHLISGNDPQAAPYAPEVVVDDYMMMPLESIVEQINEQKRLT